MITGINKCIGNKYKFNGQEWQEELGLNLYDMDFRDYDPAIARWMGIDPITHHNMSPYNAFDDNPVFWADPSGANSAPNQWLQGFDGVWHHVDGSNFVEVWNSENADSSTAFPILELLNDLMGGSSTNLAINNPQQYPWDKDGDSKLSKFEADYWFQYGMGVPIDVDNSCINWAGLVIPNNTPINGRFSIETHDAFLKLPLETAKTYGGTSFVRTGILTADVQDQTYHYDLRPNNSMRNFLRNVMTEVGRPDAYTGQGYNYRQNVGRNFAIHYLNPSISFVLRQSH